MTFDEALGLYGEVEVWVDGACSRGVGGWGAVFHLGPCSFNLAGAEPATTNNRMELLAAASALEALGPLPRRVTITSDSTYVVSGMTSWLASWRATGRLATLPNADLWLRLEAAAQGHDVSWRHVRGHAGDPGNEAADRLAVAARLDLARRLPRP